MAQSIDGSLRFSLPSPPRRRRRWLLIVIALIVVLVAGGTHTALSYYIDWLWFGSLGYADVFWKTLRLQSTTFLAFSVATFLILYAAFLGLKRLHRDELPSERTILVGGQPLQFSVDPILRYLTLGAAVLIAVGTGAGMVVEWPKLALYWYAAPTSAGVVDPIFGRPLNFYLFTLPAWQLISGWLMTLAVIIGAAAVFFLFLTDGGGGLGGRRSGYLPMAWRGLSLSLAFFLLILAFRVYLSRFEQLFEDHTIFGGVTYTGAHVMLPGLLVICVALVVGAAFAAINALTAPQVRWFIAAIAPALVCYLAVQVVGGYVSSFIVKPNQLARERPFIAHNIELTRQAYRLNHVSQREFPAETNVAAVNPANNQPTLQNIRLWDWRALQDTLRQIQEIRSYYDFPDIDIDRYEINGSLREVMLADRELNINKLPESSRNWINEKLIYTHGYGLTMNPVNGFTPEGLPKLILSDMPVESAVPSLRVTRPEIYFGELTNTDVYVKTRQKEFNYPQGQANSFTTYEGKDGIVLGSFLRRSLIALARGDIAKLPFSDDVNPQSRLLMRRNVRARVAALAPFLTYDRDPYLVVGDDGRLSWILDAYTTSDSYPYSSHYSVGDNSINYIRNSVKVVVDAYDGTTTFYVFDAQDPILATYRRVFPDLFKDAAQMPQDLRQHVRYPESLLKLQGAVYSLYHMTEPEVFFNREDLWTMASEVRLNQQGEQQAVPLEPNYILMRLPEENSGLEFVTILPFTPANRNNLIGWIGGRSDGAHYGELVAYDFPKTKLVDGPLQVEARIDQNAQLSGQLTLWNQQGSQVRRGTLLVIPTGRALLYAEPIYLQAQQSPMPELRLVVLALQDRLTYGPTFESAMASLFGGAASSTSVATGPPAPAQSTPATSAAPQTVANLQTLIAEAARNFADYQHLTAEGKLGEAGQKLEQLKRELNR